MHRAWSELIVGLQRFDLRRGGIGGAERVEHGAYLKYGRRPVSLRQNPCGGEKGSMSSKLSSNNRRLKSASLGGPRHARRGPRGPADAGALALARGSRWCKCMDLQYRVMVGAVLPTQGAREGVQYYVMPWWRNWVGIQYLSAEGAVLSTQSS